jgi:hypothetical protein
MHDIGHFRASNSDPYILQQEIITVAYLEIGVSVVDWIGLAQDRYRCRALVNSVMNLWVP